MSGGGKPYQVQVFGVELYPARYPGFQLRAKNVVKSGVNPFLVVEGIEEQNSLRWIDRLLSPYRAWSREDNENHAQESESCGRSTSSTTRRAKHHQTTLVFLGYQGFDTFAAAATVSGWL